MWDKAAEALGRVPTNAELVAWRNELIAEPEAKIPALFWRGRSLRTTQRFRAKAGALFSDKEFRSFVEQLAGLRNGTPA